MTAVKSSETVVTARKSRWPSTRRLLVAIALLAAGVIVVFAVQRGRMSRVDRGMRALLSAFDERRFIEPRLSGGFACAQLEPSAQASNKQEAKLAEATNLILEAVSAHEPGSRTAYARLLLSQGIKTDEAQRQLLLHLQESPDDAAALNDLGVCLFRQSRLEDAIDRFDLALSKTAGMKEALFNRGLCYQQMALQEPCTADFNALLAIEKDKVWRSEVARRMEDATASAPRPQTPEERVADLKAALSAPDAESQRSAVFSYETLGLEAMKAARAYLSSPTNDEESLASLHRVEALGKLAIDTRDDPAFDHFTKYLSSLSLEAKQKTSEMAELRKTAGEKYDAGDYAGALADSETILAQTESEPTQLIRVGAIDLGSRCKYQLGRFEDSIEGLQKCARFYKDEGWSYELGRAYLNLALTYTRLGRDSTAIEYGLAAEQANIQCHEPVGKALQCLAVANWNLGDMTKALDYLRRSTSALRRGYTRPDDIAHNFLLMADIYRRTDHHSLALLAAQQTLDLAVAAKDPSRASQASSLVALELAHAGQFDEADQKVVEALEYVEPLPAARREYSEPLVLTRAAEIALMRNDSRKALEYWSKTETIAGAKEGNIALRVNALRGSAEAYAIDGDRARAEDAFKRAVDLIDQHDVSLKTRSQRFAFLDASQSVFDKMIGFELAAPGREVEAFGLVEHSRARVLASELMTGIKPAAANVNQNIVPEIRSALPRGAILLSYAVTDDRTYIFLIDHDGLKTAVSQATSSQLTRLVGDFVSGIVDKHPIEELSIQARELYRLLLEPVQTWVRDGATICIVPDKALHRLPFAALKDSSDRYLVENLRITYAPSASVLLQCLARAGASQAVLPESILAVGNPTFDRDRFKALSGLVEGESEVTRSAAGYQEPNILIREQATESAVRSGLARADVAHFAVHCLVDPRSTEIASLLLAKDNSASGATPSRKDDLSARKSGHGIEQLAASDHAAIDPTDGIMSLSEVYNLRLPRTKLVILSACETGLGQYFRGEGMVSLTHPFMVAGVSTVVASLWKVESEATSDLMIEFHGGRTRLKQHAADALRSSQLKLLGEDKYAHPYYWASFMVVGGNY